MIDLLSGCAQHAFVDLAAPTPSLTPDRLTTRPPAGSSGLLDAAQAVYADLNPRPPLARGPTAASPSGPSARGSHRLATAAACERLWAMSYYFGFRSRYNPPWRAAGSAAHAALAYYFAERIPRDLRPSPPAWFVEHPDRDAAILDAAAGAGPITPAVLDMVRFSKRVPIVYDQQYAAGGTIPVYVEEEFSATIGELDPGGLDPSLDAEVVTCKPDLVALVNGELWVDDHKTVSPRLTSQHLPAFNDAEWQTWQALLNLHIVRARLGADRVAGFRVRRVLRREPIQIDENPVYIPAPAYAEAPRTARAFVKREREIAAGLRAGTYRPSANFSACMGKYGPCDLRSWCWADSAAHRDSVLETDFVQIGQPQPRAA